MAAALLHTICFAAAYSISQRHLAETAGVLSLSTYGFRRYIKVRPGYSMLFLITALTALGSISVSIYLPSLPSLASSLHASPSSVKLSLTVFLLLFALTQLAYGPLSDRLGRRPPILTGLIIYLLGSIACAFACNATALILARAIQGIGAAAGPALGRAILRDLYSAEKLTASLSTVAAAVALSPMLGPALGGYLQIFFGWRSCFVFLSIAAIALQYAAYRWLPETNAQLSSDGLRIARVVENYAKLFADREYLSALLCGGMLTAGNFAWNAGAPFLFGAVYHFTPDQYGNIALLIGLGYVVGTLLTGRLSARLSPPTIVYSGMALALSASLALGLLAQSSSSYLPVVIAMMVFTAGMGIVIPMSAACALSRHPEIAGAAAGLLGAMQIITGALGTLTVAASGMASIAIIAGILLGTSCLSLIAAYVALLPFRNKLLPTQGQLA